MAVMTRSKTKPSKSKTGPKTKPQTQTPRMSRTAEAPDRGIAREVPVSGRVKIAEAPDAGEGRQALWDHDFTHGRSQS